MIKADLKDIVNYFSDNWHRKSTLIVFLGLVSFISLFAISTISIENISILKLVLIVCILITSYIIWYNTTKLPVNKKNKVGFCVAISCEGKEEQSKISNDFINEIQTYLFNSSLSSTFYFLKYPKYYSNKITTIDLAGKFMNRSRCHFMIYGTAKKRNINGSESYILKLNGLVKHRTLPEIVRKRFQIEFSEIFPKKLHIPIENDFETFEFTSEWISVIAKYIVSMAATLSGDVDLGEKLLFELTSYPQRIKTNLPLIQTLLRKIPNTLYDVYIIQLRKHHFLWRQNKNLEVMNNIYYYIQKINDECKNKPVPHELLAIWYFVTTRDIQGAKSELMKCRKSPAPTWKYGLAFLYAYEGDLQTAVRYYNLAFFEGYFPELVFELEEFIIWCLSIEPDKYTLNYCLGLINYRMKEDIISAKREFSEFIVKSNGSYPREELKASKIISKLDKSIHSES